MFKAVETTFTTCVCGPERIALINNSLLISNGIHKLEILNKGILEVSKEYETVVNYTQSDLKW